MPRKNIPTPKFQSPTKGSPDKAARLNPSVIAGAKQAGKQKSKSLQFTAGDKSARLNPTVKRGKKL